MMRDNRDLYHRRTFWPRSERPELLGEVDLDRPCPSCGYNLRGLLPGSACPECGSRDGLNLVCDPVPWAVKPGAYTFLKTALLVVFRPRDFARQLWSHNRLDLTAARQFRRLALLLAAPVLCAIVWRLTAAEVGARAASWCLIFNVPAIIIWLNAATLEPVNFFRDKASGRLLKRVEVLAHYASAPLVLAPLQIALMSFTLPYAETHDALFTVAALHLGALMLMMLPGVLMVSALTYETIDVSRPAALGVTVAAATAHLGSAAVLLLGMPLFAASIVGRMVN